MGGLYPHEEGCLILVLVLFEDVESGESLCHNSNSFNYLIYRIGLWFKFKPNHSDCKYSELFKSYL